jgi:hypothetical protein
MRVVLLRKIPQCLLVNTKAVSEAADQNKMLIQEYKKLFPTWEQRKQKLRQKDPFKLFFENKIHRIISRTANELDSIFELEGLEFCIVDSEKVRLSSDQWRVIRNKRQKYIDFPGHDIKSIRDYCKNLGPTRIANLGLKGGFVFSRKQNKFYYLFFIDIDNDGVLLNKALKLRQQIGIDTFIVETPRGGYHLYFILESDIDVKNEIYWQRYISDSKLFDIKNLDIKMKGYVLSPGSVTKKGTYNVINESPVAVLKLETWRETIFEKIKPWLIENKIEFSTPDSLSSSSRESNSSISMKDSPKTLETTGEIKKDSLSSSSRESNSSISMKDSPKTLETTGEIKKDTRSNTLVRLAGGIVWSSKTEQDLFEKLLKIRNTKFEDPESFSINEVKNLTSWLWNKHQTFKFEKPSSSKRESNSSISMKDSSPLTIIETKLVEIFKQFKTTEKHEQSLILISASVQKYYEHKFNTKYSKPIKQQVVAKILKQAGFSSKIVEKNKKRLNLWNFPEELISKIEEILKIESWKPSSPSRESNSSISMKEANPHGVHAEHQASMNDEQLNSEPATKPLHSHSDNPEQQTEIEFSKLEYPSKPLQDSAEPATETKEQTPMNKQEPIETALNNIQEQIIETLLEINKATDITPTQRKQYFVEVCDLINYSIWKDLPKHIENLIPRDQIIKIIRRK